MTQIIKKKNIYYLKVNNIIVFKQQIINSSKIPSMYSSKLYWYMYILFIANKFGYIKL